MLEDRNDMFSILSVLYMELNSSDSSRNYISNRVVDRIGNNEITYNVSRYEQRLLFHHQSEVCTKTPLCQNCEIRLFCMYFKEKQMKSVNIRKPSIVDLFCGSGGFSLGFKQEGFRIVWANDIDDSCVNTYRYNHPELSPTQIVMGDIRLMLNNFDNLINCKEIDVVMGGPPCQGFSNANRQRLIDDPRNVLYKSFVEAVSILRPKFFIMENVRGMLKISKQIANDFSTLQDKYDVSSRIVNAYDFGIPQNRERVIFIGNRIGISSESILEQITQCGNSNPKTTLVEALAGLSSLIASTKIHSTEVGSEESGRKIELIKLPVESDYLKLINNGNKNRLIYNHKARYNNDRDIKIFSRMLPGDKSDDSKIADIMPYSSRNHIFRDKYFKLQGERPCKTITAHMKYDCNMYIHPTQARGLTPREAARVQSYPDNYFFRGAYTKTYMQIGNSVPPLISRAIAKTIKSYLK